MPTSPTIRTPFLRLPGMRRAHAPGLGRTNQLVRRNVPRLRRLLTPKISRRRQPTEALMIMITEECRPEEMQALATRRPADEGSMNSVCALSPRRFYELSSRPKWRDPLFPPAQPRHSRSFYSQGCPVQAPLGGGFPWLNALDFPTLTSKGATLGWATHHG